MKQKKKELKEIELCVRWIQTVPKITKNINTDRSSYNLKHQVQSYFNTYISNDSFKIAAQKCDLMTVKVSELNECYNIVLNEIDRHLLKNKKIQK
jgi:hypothetical protein